MKDLANAFFNALVDAIENVTDAAQKFIYAIANAILGGGASAQMAGVGEQAAADVMAGFERGLGGGLNVPLNLGQVGAAGGLALAGAGGGGGGTAYNYGGLAFHTTINYPLEEARFEMMVEGALRRIERRNRG
jgi:hypothetical protein